MKTEALIYQNRMNLDLFLMSLGNKRFQSLLSQINNLDDFTSLGYGLGRP